jgi:hypothetical protein
MANLLQSSQNVATCAPSYYTNYLNTLASKGLSAECGSKYVGAQPLQQQAFCMAANTAGNTAQNFTTGAGILGCAANTNISGAAAPNIAKATSASPLCAAKPYICGEANLNLGQLAECYMSPYLKNQVQNLSDIAQRNIQMNLAPQATAATVGSGQFGSQRGAQALGQVEANAEQCLNSTIANLENSAYSTALCAAKAKQTALGTAANTSEAAQAAQNQIDVQAATEAANAATQCAANKTTAGLGLGTLGTGATNAKIACENALETLGTACQTIKQNAQCYCIAKLGKLSSIMQGQAVPTTVKTTLCMSPLSAIASGAAALKASGLTCTISKGLSGILNGGGSSGCSILGTGCVSNCAGNYCICNNPYLNMGGAGTYAKGGSAHGCMSTRHLGGLPSGRK